MPVRKFHSIAEMENNTWRSAGDPALFRAIKQVWDFADRTTNPRFPPGVYKHRSIEEAWELEEQWALVNFKTLHASRESARKNQSPAE